MLRFLLLLVFVSGAHAQEIVSLDTRPGVTQSFFIANMGGEKAQAAAYAAWQTLAGDRVRWVNTYGPTETSVVATHFEIGDS